MSTVHEPDARRPTAAHIDLKAFDRNVDAVLARLPAGSKMVAVLKADAYGHGAVQLARRCGSRAAAIAVALLEEAVELRDAGIDLPILVLTPLQGEQFDILFSRNVTPGVAGPEMLEELIARAMAAGWKGEIHLKLDSGMGRMGFVESDLEALAASLQQARGIRVAGIYTHFANASDPADPHTEKQIEVFRRMVARLRELGSSAPLHHAANSAAIMRGLIEPGDWARAGIVLYGAEPMDEGGTRLEPVLRWTSQIMRLKTLAAGSPVGYGLSHRTSRESRIATLPVGYADGYSRSLSNRAEVLVRGKRAPVVGRVSMDLVTIDVTDIEGAAPGDEVVLIGRQGESEIPVEELAEKSGTIPWETLCAISARVPRIYHE